MNLQIYEEASDWVVKHRNDELTASERKAFDAWLRESPQHVRAYLEMSSLWEDVPSLYPGRNATSDELIARARADQNVVALLPSQAAVPNRPSAISTQVTSERGSAPPKRDGSPVRRHRQPWFLALAASAVLALVGAWLYSQRGVYRTSIGEQRSLALADGSSVELNSLSRIKVQYSDRERRVELEEGQALFRVAKNAARPFIVQTDQTEIRALGTAFDVYRTEKGAVVTVVEGRVAVQNTKPPSASPTSEPRAPSGTAQVLDAGEQLAVTSSAAVAPAPKPADVAVATAWTRRSLVFDFSPLTEVAREFNRYNTRRLVIEDPRLESFLVSGVFSSIEPRLLLRFLRAQPELVVEETDSEIRISER